MIIIKAKTTTGKIVDRYIPENNSDIQELKKRNGNNEVDIRESFADDPELWI